MSTYDLNVYVEAINNARRQLPNGTLEEHRAVDLVAWELAKLIERDNPHFDASEFFRATSTVPPTEET